MTNKEYIDLHPEKFKDDIDKLLFTEFSIIGGCCSAQGSMEYSGARMVAEKMKQQIVDKATEWLCHNYDKYIRIIGSSVYPAYAELCKDFQKAMED